MGGRWFSEPDTAPEAGRLRQHVANKVPERCGSNGSFRIFAVVRRRALGRRVGDRGAYEHEASAGVPARFGPLSRPTSGVLAIVRQECELPTG